MSKIAHVHVQVADTAKALTHELYDELMKNDQIRAAWREQHPGLGPKGLENAFVKKYWGRAIPAARATLATLLRTSVDETLKERIMEALQLDHTLLAGRQSPSEVIGRVGE